MARSQQKRQKKLDKHKAKQRAEKRARAQQRSLGMAYRLERTAAAPILHSVATEETWTEGMGNVLVSRQLSSGKVAFAMFLLDMYCLGVKDAFCNIVPASEYEERLYRDMAAQYRLVHLSPEAARKLVEGAVDFAEKWGFPPHHDYLTAKAIFGDISAADAEEEFEYGKHGKPVFIAGPYDDAARCAAITRTLTARMGGETPEIIVHPLRTAILPPEWDDEDEEEE